MYRRLLSWMLVLAAGIGLVLPWNASAAPPRLRRAAQTDGTYVVWLETQDAGAPATLMAGKIQKDKTIGQAQVLTERFWAPVNQGAFDLIGGGIVAWLEVSGDKTSLIMRDLNNPRSANTALVSVAASTGMSVPAVASGRIVWREGSSIKRYDVAKAAFTTLTTQPATVALGDPQISGGWVVWAAQTKEQRHTPIPAGSLYLVSAPGKIVKFLDSMECGQICYYQLSGNSVLYTRKQEAIQVRDLISGEIYRDDGSSAIAWSLVDGPYVFDRSQPTAYHLREKRQLALPFAPSDVRDGWIVGVDQHNAVRVARISEIAQGK